MEYSLELRGVGGVKVGRQATNWGTGLRVRERSQLQSLEGGRKVRERLKRRGGVKVDRCQGQAGKVLPF